jgi:cell fate (sporulation/competence/biofilm development) regulator YmcA (YheA/YmcA/DUF963 family)
MMAGVSIVCGARANAQTAQESNPHVISNQDLDLLRKDIRSKKKQLVAANLKLTDTEATKFWPIYDQYTAELIAINDKKFALVQNYADNWSDVADLIRKFAEDAEDEVHAEYTSTCHKYQLCPARGDGYALVSAAAPFSSDPGLRF